MLKNKNAFKKKTLKNSQVISLQDTLEQASVNTFPLYHRKNGKELEAIQKYN